MTKTDKGGVYDVDGRVSETVVGLNTKYLVADQNLTAYAQVTVLTMSKVPVTRFLSGLRFIDVGILSQAN